MPAATNYLGVLKDSLFEMEGTDYANQLTRVRLVPDVPSQQIRTLVPDGVINDTDSATYTLEIAGIQKLAAGGLLKLLNESEPGTLLDVTWQPLKDTPGQPEYTLTVKSKPGPVGGDQGAFATFELVLDVEGSATPVDQVSA
jgi:hypothetical protein